MSECTEYVWNEDMDPDDYRHPCHCPKCKGFLKWEEKDGEHIPICNKCHTPLVVIPDQDSTEDAEWGRICIVKPFGEKNNV